MNDYVGNAYGAARVGPCAHAGACGGNAGACGGNACVFNAAGCGGNACAVNASACAGKVCGIDTTYLSQRINTDCNVVISFFIDTFINVTL